MYKCRCSPDCEALVIGVGKKYAQGHSPASRTDMVKTQISTTLKKGYRSGKILPFQGGINPAQRPSVQAKLSKAWIQRKTSPKYLQWKEKRSANAITKKTHRCICSPTCKAEARFGRMYAPGHRIAPNKGKPHKKTTLRKIKAYAQTRPEAHNRKIGRALTARFAKLGCPTYLSRRTGFVLSDKAGGKVVFHSNLERRFILWMNAQSWIHSFAYEPVAIPYHYNGIIRHHHPDYIIFCSRARWLMVEVKPSSIMRGLFRRRRKHHKEFRKMQAAYSFCQAHNLRYMVVDEHWLDRKAA